jgi:hypothetical protein
LASCLQRNKIFLDGTDKLLQMAPWWFVCQRVANTSENLSKCLQQLQAIFQVVLYIFFSWCWTVPDNLWGHLQESCLISMPRAKLFAIPLTNM